MTDTTMTCQCCWRKFQANTGTVAHHGFKRPGDGWQSASCMGAKYLPLETNRHQLLVLINMLKLQRDNMIAGRSRVFNEDWNKNLPGIHVTIDDRSKERDARGHRPKIELFVTRGNFETLKKQHAAEFVRHCSLYSFQAIFERELNRRQREIDDITSYLKDCAARYDGWKQTHSGFDRPTKTWNLI